MILIGTQKQMSYGGGRWYHGHGEFAFSDVDGLCDCLCDPVRLTCQGSGNGQ